LINPIDAAAAEPVRKVVGSDQNEGKKLYNPAAATQNIVTARAVLLWLRALNSSPIPATIIGAAVCHRRSPERSDDHPTTINATNPVKYGSAEINVTSKFGRPDNALTIVGSQKLKPYRPVMMKK
jgi:hypothetical protein